MLYGIVALAILWWLSRSYMRHDAKDIAKILKMVGGVLALGAAVLVGLRGRLDMALLAGGIGAWFLGWKPASWFARRPHRLSRMRSALIEIEIDQKTGLIGGFVLAGPYGGSRLEDLDRESLLELHAICYRSDPDGLALLEAYLDRRFAAWRENAQRDGDPRARRKPQPGAMTEQEAYQVLGLQSGASVAEIQRTYRTLMKKFHPDRGGTGDLAARVNQAKDVLLSRHR